MTSSKRNVIAYKDLPPALGLSTIAVGYMLMDRWNAPGWALSVFYVMVLILIISAIYRFCTTEQVSIVPQNRTGPAPAADDTNYLGFKGEIEITREGEFLTVNVIHKGRRMFGFAPQPVESGGTMLLRGIEIRMQLTNE